jgi:hypothetical protein
MAATSSSRDPCPSNFQKLLPINEAHSYVKVGESSSIILGDSC